MIKWKAILAGVATIVTLGLLAQLAFIFLAVGYTELNKTWPDLAALAKLLAYLFGTVVYFLVMATGGYVSAYVSGQRVVLHALIVSVLVIGVTLIPLLSSAVPSIQGVLVFGLGIVFTVAGGLLWARHGDPGGPVT